MGEGSSAERVPPHSQEAEVAVLGAIMLEPKAMNATAPVLTADCFYRADHQKLYAVFAGLYAKNQPIDVVSVKEELRRMGEDDIASDADLFMTLGGAVPSAANAEYYANVVRQKYLLRLLISACNESLVEAYDEHQEVIDILDQAEQRVFNVATRFEASRPVEVKEVINAVVDDMQHPERLLGLQTDYTDLDHLTGGLRRGEFVVVGGRPSSGKTTLALNLIEHIGIHQSQGVLLFSMEMPREQIVQNLLCCHARVDSTGVRSGQLARGEWEKIRDAASLMYESPIFIDDSGMLTCSQLRSKCRHLFARQAQTDRPIRLVIVDYLQLMSSDRRGREFSRLQEITEISRNIKALAKDLNVPIIALSQLSRAAEGDASARPRLSHLRESGAIEQDADLVVLLYRAELSDPEAADGNVTELIVAKHRNGPTGLVRLTFLKNEMRFESYSTYDAAQVGISEEGSEPF